ncbi:MAG: ATP-binding protein [Dehalococcoidia bacterium]
MRVAQRGEQHIHQLDESIEDVASQLDDLRPGEGALDATGVRRLRASLDELRAAETALVRDHRQLAAERDRSSQERARYRALFDESNEACIVTDGAGFVLEANRAAAELANRSTAELARLPIAALLGGEGRRHVPMLLERVRREGRVSDMPLRVRRDGHTRDVLACICLIGGSGRSANIAWHLRDDGSESLDHVELERRIRERTIELEEAHGARDEFLSLMSHELKTPIAVIAGNAEVLARRESVLSPDQRTEALTDIRNEASRLQRVVDNLLALARLERGQQIGREPVDIEPIIRERTEHHHAEWPEREFVIDVAAGLPLVDAARAYVSQALRNLITNAEQHSPPERPIEVRAWAEDGGVVVTVVDSGAGVTEEQIDRLFGAFHRPSDGDAPLHGAGLGLAVTRRLIEEQHGRLSVERIDGGGMAFSFWLPAHD